MVYVYHDFGFLKRKYGKEKKGNDMQNATMNANVATKTCPYCGSVVPANAQKCQKCGEWLVQRYGKSWVKTLLLCSFLGGVGGHDFFNGKSGLGIAKIFTFFGFCFIWPVIDYFMILCDGYSDSEGRKLSRKPTKAGLAVFCFLGFFGCAGLHRFYTKHTGIAFLQLFTFGGFFVWTLIDFVMILAGKFQDADGKYITE